VNAGWQLYDDFNSGKIDNQKWFVDDSCANISIENGEAKFVHNPGYPFDSSWLQIIYNPQNIIGIRTKIRIQSCTGDVRGRAGGWVGKIGENFIWSEINAQSERGKISIYADLHTPDPEHDFIYRLFYSSLKERWNPPFNITGKTIILEWIYNPNEIIGKTDSHGEIEFKYFQKVSPNENQLKGVGTRSVAGDGPCTVYFDDIYVYRQTSSAATNLLLLGE
jgi:hypothetical protein